MAYYWLTDNFGGTMANFNPTDGALLEERMQ